MISPEFERSHDVAALNALLNHPRIRPNMGGDSGGGLGGDSVLDGAPLLDIFYLSDAGGMLFHGSEGVYEGHYLFTSQWPMSLALGMVRACMLEGAELIWGRVPVGNRAARIFTRRLGFKSLGIRECPFPAELFWKTAP